MTPFSDPELKRKPATTPLADCSTCQNCATPMSMVPLELPFKMAMFCIKEKRYLLKGFNHGRYITGIENATTCPNFKKND